MDLKSLITKIQNLIGLQNCREVVKLMGAVTKKLEEISDDILTTGETIINRLQFVPKSLSYEDSSLHSQCVRPRATQS